MAEAIRGRAALQEWLVQRIARELSVNATEIDPDARIMTLGVDSLAMIGLAGELADVTNCELRAEILWEYDTIAALAGHLTQEQCSTNETNSGCRSSAPISPDASPLSMLRNGTSGSPVIAVGSMSIAALLKNVLPEHVPVGRLQLDEMYRGPQHVRSISQMAAAFAKDVTQRFPSSPLTLIGFSYCGLVAFDLACQLVDQQREVRLLLLEPARFDRGPLPEKWSKRVRRHARALYQQNWEERRGYLRDRLQFVHDRVQVKLFRRRLVARKQSGTSVPSRFRWMLGEPGLMASLRGYQLPELKGSAVIAARPAWFTEQSTLWTRHIEKEMVTLSLVDVPDHRSVALEDAAQIWMPIVRDWHADDRKTPSAPGLYVSQSEHAAIG